MAAATASPRPTSAALQMPLQIVGLQALIAIGCAAALAAAAASGFGSMAQAVAAVLAGVCVCLPGVVVARAVAAPGRAGPTAAADELGAPVQPIAWIVGGLMATVALMALAFALFKPPAVGFFTALVATQLAPVIAPAWQDRQRRRARSASR